MYTSSPFKKQPRLILLLIIIVTSSFLLSTCTTKDVLHPQISHTKALLPLHTVLLSRPLEARLNQLKLLTRSLPRSPCPSLAHGNHHCAFRAVSPLDAVCKWVCG